MALPRPLQVGLLPSEVEYLSTTETLVQIVPLLPIDRVRLLGGIYGPFRPPALATVPLWLAVNLKGKNKCTIVPPEWLTVEALQDLVREETSSPRFAKVPLHYVAVSKVLLDASSDSIPQSSEVRSLLKDLREARQSKVLAGLEHLNAVHLEMTNISLLEIAELRPFFTSAFRHLATLAPANEQDAALNGAIAGDGDDDDDDDDEGAFLSSVNLPSAQSRQGGQARYDDDSLTNRTRTPYDAFADTRRPAPAQEMIADIPAPYLQTFGTVVDPFAEFDQQLQGEAGEQGASRQDAVADEDSMGL